MKKILILILQILGGLIFPIILYISFIDTDIGIDYYYIFLFYIIFWIIPIIIFESKKNLFIKLIFINIITLLLLIYIFGLYAVNLSNPRILEAYDERQEIISSGIIKELSTTDTSNIKSMDDYLKNNPMITGEIVDFYNCYYLSSIENGSGFILAYKYNSQENINKYGKNYFLYNSLPDYKISTEEMNKILDKINKKCIQ